MSVPECSVTYDVPVHDTEFVLAGKYDVHTFSAGFAMGALVGGMEGHEYALVSGRIPTDCLKQLDLYAMGRGYEIRKAFEIAPGVCEITLGCPRCIAEKGIDA